ncbi:MAG: response regulator [Anaerolineaceae bacterium]
MKETSIFVIEDEPSIAEVVSLYLRRAGFKVRIISDGRQAMEVLGSDIPDLVIIDLMLPGVDGLAITRWLRTRSEVPIIMLTARREEADRISGFEMGADDYVIKPFSPPELVGRVKAVLRRSSQKLSPDDQNPITLGSLKIDPQTRRVQMEQREIILTAKEFEMLHWLARHPHQVFTRDKLLEIIWGLSDVIDPSAVTVHIRRLREKIENNPAEPVHIVTVWGVGYKFEP